MQNKSEENKSLSEKILSDIQQTLYNDVNLKEFCVVPTPENKNKSPVLYEEHNLGLESWCVKYVFAYLYEELFKVRSLLRKNKLPWCKSKKLDKLLIGGLLINPEIQTFWNMRRELINYGELSIDKELQLVQLVLSNRCKSSEAFAYRRWILNRLLKNVKGERFDVVQLLHNEFFVCTMAAGKSKNNYHAWNHRIWCLEHIASKFSSYVSPMRRLDFLTQQLTFSTSWITTHVSEHSGYHFRQYICNSIFDSTDTLFEPFQKYFEPVYHHMGLKFSECDFSTYLENLLGKRDNISNVDENLNNTNYACYLNVLLFDLLNFLPSLNQLCQDHESIWYHRRFIVYNLLRVLHKYHHLVWESDPQLNESHKDEKCVIKQDEECSKVELSYLYNFIVENERKFITENSDKCGEIQREFATRHEKWLRAILCVNRI